MARSRRRRSSGRKQRPAPDPNYIELASVVKPHGLDGEVWVDLNTDFPERLPDWPALEIVGRGGPARAHVEYVKGIVGGRCIVKLEGVEDRDEAEAIRNHILRIERRMAASLGMSRRSSGPAPTTSMSLTAGC
ncbi:MAG: ribosome maturation factor RimM [Armatimonadota bacterium]